MINHYLQDAFRPELSGTRTAAPSALWAVGTSLILFPALVFAITTLWFMAGGAISPVFAWFVLIACVAGSIFVSHRLFPGTARVAPALTVGLILVAALVSSLFHDTSMDGQQYHFQAIYALAEGWNPLQVSVPPPVIGDPITPWAVHYPRAVWVFAANLLAAGLPLETIKLTNLLVLLAGAALLSEALFRAGFSAGLTVVLTVLAVANPIATSQIWTSMNDGMLVICMLIFVVSIASWLSEARLSMLVAGVAAMVLALNLKFSAVPTFAILCAFVCIGVFLSRGWQMVLKAGVILLATAVTAIFVFGWSPYMQNLLDHGHVFHPVLGPNAIDIMTGGGDTLNNTPPVLENMSAVERFFFSLFSQTHAGYETMARVKMPFTIAPEELRAAGGVDVRLAGFGLFFSGAALLATVCVIALLVQRGKLSPATCLLLFVAGALLISVIIMPENWWARYVPQFWLVPVCIAAAALTVNDRKIQYLGVSIVAVMLANATVSGSVATWLTFQRSVEVSEQATRLKETGQSYCVSPNMAQSRLILMQQAGIDTLYVAPGAIACDTPESVAGYGPDRFGGEICPCSE